MLKRVVRRALGARGNRQSSEPTAPAAPAAPGPVSAPAPAASTQLTDAPNSIAARIARGAANSALPAVSATSGARDPASEDIHTGADGRPYWGPVNNDSARARARGETLIIDQWECISCGTCVENTDAVFILPDDAKAVVKQQQGDMTLIQDAIDACPVTCIHWSADPNEFEQLNDSAGKPTHD